MTKPSREKLSSPQKWQLTEINKDLDQLGVRIEKSSDAAQAEAQPKLQALRDQADRLGKQFDEVRNSIEFSRDSVKTGPHQAYAALKDGLLKRTNG